MNLKIVSIIIPVFNEEANIIKTIFSLKFSLSKLANLYNFEVIFVDDGSKDGSFNLLRKAYFELEYVKVIRLDVNTGQHYAIFAGMYYCKGDIIVITDADLDYNYFPLSEFIYGIKVGYDCILGYRVNSLSWYRKGINRLISLIIRVPFHDITCPYRAFNKKVIQEIRREKTVEKVCFKKRSFLFGEIKVFYNFNSLTSHYNFLKKSYLFFDIVLNLLRIRRQDVVLNKVKEFLK